MQFLFDHINAAIMGAAVFFMLLAVQIRGTEAVVDQNSYRAAKAQALAFGEFIQDDLTNIGLGVSSSTSVITAATSSVTTFLRKIDTADATPSIVSYTVTASDTLVHGDDSYPIFDVVRTVNGVQDGQGPTNITKFVVEMRDENGTVVSDLDDTKTIHVRFAVVSPYGEKHYIKSINWSRTLRPSNLQ